jgi:hypothetical protein
MSQAVRAYNMFWKVTGAAHGTHKKQFPVASRASHKKQTPRSCSTQHFCLCSSGCWSLSRGAASVGRALCVYVIFHHSLKKKIFGPCVFCCIFLLPAHRDGWPKAENLKGPLFLSNPIPRRESRAQLGGLL